MIAKLLLEGLDLTAIARVVRVSKTWLQKYVNDKFENIEKEVEVFAFGVEKSVRTVNITFHS